MDSFLWEQTPLTRTGCAQPRKRYGHHLLHPLTQSPKGKGKRHHLRLDNMFNQTRKNRQTKPDKVSCRGGQSALSVRHGHTHCQPTYHQAVNKQRNLNSWGKICHYGHQKLLPLHPYDLVQIYEAQTLGYA